METVVLCTIVFAFAGAAHATPPPAGASLQSVATATYIPTGLTLSESVSSNLVIAIVQAVESVLLTQSQSVTRPQGSNLLLSHFLTNTGNVASTYTFDLRNGGAGCPQSTFSLNSLHLTFDANRNGVSDGADTPIPLGKPDAVSLMPGESAALLVQANVPLITNGSSCASLSAVTSLQSVAVSNQDVVTIGAGALLSLTKSAIHDSVLIPGQSRIDFRIFATNVGNQDARPSNVLAPTLSSLLIDGAQTSVVLIRDLVPAGTHYVVGSLSTTAGNAVRLYRRPGAPDFAFQTQEASDAVEVAIGIAAPVVVNASVAMQFGVILDSNQVGNIVNVAGSYYNDGLSPTLSPSNTVVVVVAATEQVRIGVSKEASAPVANRSADGTPDGTATIRFKIHARGYGGAPLHNVQVTDLLEGVGAGKFGSYTTVVVPGPNQYTVVPGSVLLASGSNVVANTAFTGTANAQNLLLPGGTLAPGVEATVQFDLRVNLVGLTAPLSNVVKATAATGASGQGVIFDESVDGPDPDPDGDGNPNNNSSTTFVSTQVPFLTLAKTASLPRRIDAGIYEIDYKLRVSNTGNGPATNVRIIDNLSCSFAMDAADSAVSSWELIGAPVARNAYLVVSNAFTGRAPCNQTQASSVDPFDMPTDSVLSLTDGSRSLAAGQSEEVTFTIRAVLGNSSAGNRAIVTNKAWAAAFAQYDGGNRPGPVIAAATGSTQSVLSDPQGIVYDANSRQPVAGALVTYFRQSCSGGVAGPISATELYGAASGAYTFNGNGSVSLTTGADGSYQFFLRSPPISDLCTFGISVIPPSGSAYSTPSALIPPAAGVFSACGAVVPNANAPQAGDPTIYYGSVVAGVAGAGGAACEVLHNHIPLDSGNIGGLILRMDGSKRQAELGDFIDYALTVTNKTGAVITGVDFNTGAPIGFAYVRGSTQLNGALAIDPAGGSGPQLVFSFPSLQLAPDASATVRYRTRIGVGAPTNGDATNRGIAHSASIQSNPASWTVRISGGVFSDEAFVFGKVYLDCKPDGQQAGPEEVGVPGVRLYMENGTFAVTDVEGKWSLYGLKPITHVLRVDQTTLPPGAVLKILDNRNAGNPASRFVDLVKGEFQKADFIIGNCENRTVVADVAARRAAIVSTPYSEGEALMRTRLDPEGNRVVIGDTRALPASGQSSGSGSFGQLASVTAPLIGVPAPTSSRQGGSFVGGTGGGGGTLGALASGPGQLAAPAGSLFAPLQGISSAIQPASVASGPATSPGSLGSRAMASSGGMLEPLALPTLPSESPSPVELEKLLPAIPDNALGFIDLRDGNTVPGQSINVRVKGEIGIDLRLTVNGEVLEQNRVGKRATLAEKKLSAWEYIGVVLKPGSNTLTVESVDSFGVTRGVAQSIRLVAPDKLGAIELDVPSSSPADLRTPILVKVRLVDAAGVPVTARTQLTLESDRGRWLDEDLSTKEQGVQVFMDGGEAAFRLLPPSEPGAVRIRVSAGTFVREVVVALTAELRPMIAVGVLEGGFYLNNRGALPLGALPAGAAFESELSQLGGGDSKTRASGRSAFFLKGAVKGEYLLTASFDSDKRQKDRLFRDIRPDEFYPIYGDSSVRGFDAQSSQKLYVRIDKNRSYLLYGDFTTASSTEVRSLSQVNRTLTGAKQVYDDQTVRATTYIANTSQRQQIEEFPAVGTSGFYFLSNTGGEFVENSEQVQIIVRDRTQLNSVLTTSSLTRFVDYTIEPLTRRILFTYPIASLDAGLNPQSIRVTYEVEGGGAKFVVAGTDVQAKVNDALQVGIVANTDRNPDNQRDLAAVTGLARVGDNATVAAELVRTRSDEKGQCTGARAELRYQDEKLAAVALASKTSSGFDNPGASVSAGRTDAAVRAEYKIDPSLALRGEALYSKDSILDQDRSGATVSLQKKVTEATTVEAGVRYGQSNTAIGTGSGFDYGNTSTYNGALGSGVSAGNTTALGAAAANANASANGDDHLATVRARISTLVPGLPGAQAFVEGEQSLAESDRQTVAVGANYALTDKTRAYGRYELISGLYGPYEIGGTQLNNVGIIGIESAYMEGGRVYNEYRLADSIDGRGVVAAVGLRNTYQVSEHVRLTGGLEHTRNLSSVGNSVNNGTGYGSALGESTSVTGGAEYANERVKASAILEAREGSDSNTRLFSGGVAFKLSPELSVLARSVVSDSEGQGASVGNERQLQRHQVGLAYRPVDTNTWNALARYEHKSDKVVGAGNSSGSAFGADFGNATLPGTYTTDIIATHLNFNPQRGTYLTSRYAVKVSHADDGILSSSYMAQLIQGRVTQDINPEWDVGFQLGLLYGQGGALQKTLGGELGYQVYRDIWVSGGYNFVGLTDRDLAANEYTSKGPYVRMRMKFDEATLGLATPDPANPAGATTKTGATLVVVPESLARQPDAPALEMATKLETVPAAPQPEKTSLRSDALFDPGQSVIRRGSIGVLNEQFARIEKRRSRAVIELVNSDGNAVPGGEAHSIDQDRAETIQHFLVAKGIAASRIQVTDLSPGAPGGSGPGSPAEAGGGRRTAITVEGIQ